MDRWFVSMVCCRGCARPLAAAARHPGRALPFRRRSPSGAIQPAPGHSTQRREDSPAAYTGTMCYGYWNAASYVDVRTPAQLHAAGWLWTEVRHELGRGYARTSNRNALLLRPRARCAVGCACPADISAGHREIE